MSSRRRPNSEEGNGEWKTGFITSNISFGPFLEKRFHLNPFLVKIFISIFLLSEIIPKILVNKNKLSYFSANWIVYSSRFVSIETNFSQSFAHDKGKANGRYENICASIVTNALTRNCLFISIVFLSGVQHPNENLCRKTIPPERHYAKVQQIYCISHLACSQQVFKKTKEILWLAKWTQWIEKKLDLNISKI